MQHMVGVNLCEVALRITQLINSYIISQSLQTCLMSVQHSYLAQLNELYCNMHFMSSPSHYLNARLYVKNHLQTNYLGCPRYRLYNK